MFSNIFKKNSQYKFSPNLENFIIKEKQKVLIFSPHPDDESIACAGLIQKFIKSNCVVQVVLITNGGKKKLILGDKKTRRLEFLEATKILGLNNDNLIFLNFEEDYFKHSKKLLANKIKMIINKVVPDIIVYPHSSDIHIDHRSLGKTLQKLKERSTIHLQYLVHFGKLKFPKPYRFCFNYYIYPPSSLLNNKFSWISIDLSKDEETIKEKAVNCYKSQLKLPGLNSYLRSFIRKNEIFCKI